MTEQPRTTVRAAVEGERGTITALLDLYLDELSRHREVQTGAVDAKSYPYLDSYWSQGGHHLYVIELSGRVVGLAMVRGPEATRGGRTQLAEFFLSPECRRRGVGGEAARQILERFRGPWELQVHARNAAGIAFWTAVIRRSGCADCTEQEIRAADGRRLQFEFVVVR